MLKLYKKNIDEILYWEAWEETGKVVTHWGRLGEIGETTEIKLAASENGERLIQRECKPKLSDGFDQMEARGELVVQYKLDGWGSPGDLETRHLIEGLLQECLGWTGNGHCEGGDIGNSTINIYSMVIDVEVAAKTVIDALSESMFLEGAVVASKRDCEDDNECYKVHYPQSFKGAFSIS